MGFGVAGESGFDQRWRIEFGLHDFGQEFDGLLDAAQTGVFFFDAADGVVELLARGIGEGVEEFEEAMAAQGAGEERVNGHGEKLTTDDSD